MTASSDYFHLTTFLPAEAEEITGVNGDLIRDWRRRGVLPKVTGHARYNLISLAELKAHFAISELRLPIFERSQIVRRAVREIVHHVLDAAWQKPPESIYGGNWQRWRRGAVPEVAGIRKAYASSSLIENDAEQELMCQGGDPFIRVRADMHDLSAYIVHRLISAGALGLSRNQSSFGDKRYGDLLVVTSDGQDYWLKGTEDLVDPENPLRRYMVGKSVSYCDMELLAEGLSQRAIRPFVTITLPEVSDG